MLGQGAQKSGAHIRAVQGGMFRQSVAESPLSDPGRAHTALSPESCQTIGLVTAVLEKGNGSKGAIIVHM
ncbi:uncharacterized protein PG986_010327 [Apiospora aurea]|uniref:Uncharacterized protein n=1 Tax=Apiospora aurea TaxID=335848 RepID=A0ABR1Q1X6_9PEZI